MKVSGSDGSSAIPVRPREEGKLWTRIGGVDLKGSMR